MKMAPRRIKIFFLDRICSLIVLVSILKRKVFWIIYLSGFIGRLSAFLLLIISILLLCQSGRAPNIAQSAISFGCWLSWVFALACLKNTSTGFIYLKLRFWTAIRWKNKNLSSNLQKSKFLPHRARNSLLKRQK